MTADDAVRSYKALTGVERAFRSLKTVDLRSARSIIGAKTACARTSSCACSPTTSSGTCARRGAS